MPEPVLVLGGQRAGRATLFQYGTAPGDGDLPITLFARTAEVVVAGVAGRAVFHRIFTAVTFTHPFHLRLHPIVDGKRAENEYADIEITADHFADPANDLVEGERRTHLFEIGLSLPYIRDEVERFRRSMQGCYFQVEIEQLEPLMTEQGRELILAHLELEYEVITRGGAQ